MRRSNRKRSRSATDTRPKTTAPTRTRTRATPGPAASMTPLEAVFQRLIGEIFRFNGALLDVAAGLAEDLAVNPSHWQTVATIRVSPLTVSEISRRVGLRRQSVQHTVSQLRDRHLVELVDNPRHRRAQLVRLTPAGHVLMGALMQRQAVLTARFTGGLGLSVADIEALISALSRMQEAAEASVSRPVERPNAPQSRSGGSGSPRGMKRRARPLLQ